MGIFNKLASAFTGAGRFVGTVIDKDKKVSDFELFKDQSIKDTYQSYLKGTGAVAGASLGAGKARNMLKEKSGLLGNVISGNPALSSLLKRQNLFGGSGFDIDSILGGGNKQVPGTDFGGSFEFGSQSKKNLFLPFFAIAAVVAVLWGVFK